MGKDKLRKFRENLTRYSVATTRSKGIGAATFSITTTRSYSNWAAARANIP